MKTLEKLNWQNGKLKVDFRCIAKCLKMLDASKLVFTDIKTKMRGYFDTLNTVKHKLNNYVNKQGFNPFYVSKNHPID